MLRIAALFAILMLTQCRKKDTSDNSALPPVLQQLYNDSTYCSEDGCKAYISLIIHESKKYYALGYDIGPLCDLTTAPLPIYDENGNPLDTAYNLYEEVSKEGNRRNRIWQCKLH